MSKGVTVKIFLADGTPDGLKIVEKSNWTGIGVMCSRSQYPDVQNRIGARMAPECMCSWAQAIPENCPFAIYI
ncbi:MAG: hypothetical protein R2839_03270 [Thermomicrobiales bacterium]